MLVLVLLCLIITTSTVCSQEFVTLPDGTKLQGRLRNSVVSFKGIRYAEPPLGSLRWAPPVKWSNPNPDEIIDAINFGGMCTQKYVGGKEDCLFLNVYTPDVAINSNDTDALLLPVAIFVHGGGYVGGSSMLYDGSSFVEYTNGNSIIVTVNYRLGVFGFMGSEELRVQDKDEGSTGNYGIQDQRLAFKWVAENIGQYLMFIYGIFICCL